MTNKIAALATTMLLVSTSSAEAAVREAGHMGIGLGGGSFVSGLSGKYFFTDASALELNLGSPGFNGIGVGAAYLFEMPALAEFDAGNLAWSVGPGVGAFTWGLLGSSYTVIALQGVVGLELNLDDVPLDIVLEWRPGFWIADSVVGGLYWSGAGGHIRYYFN